MPRYEYKIIPAPEKANKIKGLKSPDRFAATLEQAMNALGADGWRYLRADTLPQEERSGLTSRSTTFRNLLVFCRELPEIQQEIAPDAASETTPSPARVPAAEPAADPADDASLANIFDLDPDPKSDENPDANR